MKKLSLIGCACALAGFGFIPQASADDPPPPDQIEQYDPPPWHLMDKALFAQNSDGAHDKYRQARRLARGDREQQQKHLEQLRILKMLELLNLDESQEVPFLTTFNSMRKEHRKLDGQIRQVLDTLADEIREGGADDNRLNRLIDRALMLERQKQQVATDFVDQSRTMLTAEQLGKFVIFRKRFEHELLERIGRFRKRRAPGPDGDG